MSQQISSESQEGDIPDDCILVQDETSICGSTEQNDKRLDKFHKASQTDKGDGVVQVCLDVGIQQAPQPQIKEHVS